MKIKQKKILKPLIKLHLLKTQIYKQANGLQSLNTSVLQLKQVLKIIYLYSKNKKKILFLGFPYNKFVHNQVNYLFHSKNSYLKKKINFNQIDLIVLHNTKDKDLNIIKNLESFNVPIVVFGNVQSKNYSFNVLTKKKSINNFILFIIFSILTKYSK